MGKTGRKNKKYSTEFKISVIMDKQEHQLGYKETVRKYWEESKGYEDRYRGTVKRWERIFKEDGGEGLMEGKRKKAEKASPTEKVRLPRTDKEIAEMAAENQRLRMEIEYIKKLSALVLADEQRNGKRRS